VRNATQIFDALRCENIDAAQVNNSVAVPIRADLSRASPQYRRGPDGVREALHFKKRELFEEDSMKHLF
jgi:hypothetical protein